MARFVPITASKHLKRTTALSPEDVTKPTRRICKLLGNGDERQQLNDLPRFGPFYGGEEFLVGWTGKEDAWNHVLRKSGANQSQTTSIYMKAMKKVEKQARATYEDKSVDHLFEDDFRLMMVKDGCFILQLTLFVLGGATQLGHDPEDRNFGEKRNKKQIERWIKSMFFVGNQIPLLVLRELMKQSFFQGVLTSGRWERPMELQRMALYEYLVVPMLEGCGETKSKPAVWLWWDGARRFFLGGTSFHLQEPPDLLAGLRLLLLGSSSQTNSEDEDSDIDDEDSDLEEGNTRVEKVDSSTKVRSATELWQAGIKFKDNKGMGIRGIRFQKNTFTAVLNIPSMTIDSDTKTLFRNLKNYELTQQLSKYRREVCAYLQFMSELIQTPDDAKLLASKGLIHARPEHRVKLPRILNKLANGDNDRNLRLVRLQIFDYSRPPWEKLKYVLNLVLLLTLVQTVYTILSYYN